MYFCPSCANLLLVRQGDLSNEFFCQTCPYVCKIQKEITTRTDYKRKQVDDILGGAAAWENVDKTNATCPRCDHPEAYYMMIQIRSADEPSTIFYKCCQCHNQWREG
ncbi:DNA-directed RNA polymerase III subunit RPC10 [Rhizophlyctis rosea]|nr:DNA-directed RNA polymerase III subunit RPC10 [Rhizophlyctis rosea]